MFMGFVLHIYIIFGTNLLTGGPARIAIFFAYFSVSKKRNIKLSPNGIKLDGDFFWNICDFWEVKSTRDGARGGHEAGGATWTLVGTP